MQEQIPQQMQQIQESTSEATTTAMISQSHHTGRHSPEDISIISIILTVMSMCSHTYAGVAGGNVVDTLSLTAALASPELGECILSFIPSPLGLVPDRAIIL